MKIFLLGDSLSRGILFDSERSKFMIAKEAFFNLLKPRINAEVENISKLGQTLDTAVLELDRKISKTRPDIVAIELGGNDCDFDWDAVSRDPDAEHICRTPFEKFEDGIRNLVCRLKSEGIIPVLINLPPIDADRYFTYFCRGCSTMEEKVLSFLGNISRIYWWHERYSSVLGLIAEETDTPLIDIRSAFMHKEDYRKYLCDDGIHPNKEGHKLIAERISELVSHKYSEILLPS